jgi:hypothetical protein
MSYKMGKSVNWEMKDAENQNCFSFFFTRLNYVSPCLIFILQSYCIFPVYHV